MLKKLSKNKLQDRIKKFIDSIVGIDEQQQMAMAVKAFRVKIKKDIYYIGRAQISDVEEILEIQKLVYDGKIPWDEKIFNSELNRKKDRLYLVVRQKDKLIGFIGSSYSRGMHDMHVTNIAVLPEWQNKGIGKFLINFIMGKAEQLNAKQVSLEVRKSNDKAQKVYNDLGFKTDGVLNKYYLDNKEDAVKMIVKLAGN